MGTFPIETERLIIRPLKMSDVNEFYVMTRDEKVKKYVPYACPLSLEDARYEFKKFYTKCDLRHDFYLAILDKKKGKLVGALIVTENIRNEYDMSHITAARHRGKGYMKECLQAFVNVMKKGSVLLFIIDKSNEPSYKLVSSLPKVEDVTQNYKLRSHVFQIIV